MKLDKFYKLKNQLETFNFETNFSNLSKTLYYFSFLGNIFLILFSYFFIKDVTNSIPSLFPGQGLFFSVFIILFMTGYELFKRFAFEQLTATILRLKKFTINILLGSLVSVGLVVGSFYLSLNGAHRLIDTSETSEQVVEVSQTKMADSISAIYQQRIALKEQQIQAIQQNDDDGVLSGRQRATIKSLETDIKNYETERDNRIAQFENRTNSKLGKEENKIQENSFAFAVMVFFLEIIILIGVAFAAYYQWTSFSEMKSILATPKYKQLETNLQLLKLYYQNGRKKEQDPVLSRSKMLALMRAAKLSTSTADLNSFLAVCSELEITTGPQRKRVYNMNYDKAKMLIESNEQ